MRLVWIVIGWFVDLAVQMVKWMLGKIVPTIVFIVQGIVFIVPWIVRAIGLTFRIMLFAFTTIWVNADTAARYIADRHMMEATDSGVVTIYASAIWWSIYIMSWICICLGWVLIGFATTFLVLLIT